MTRNVFREFGRSAPQSNPAARPFLLALAAAVIMSLAGTTFAQGTGGSAAFDLSASSQAAGGGKSVGGVFSLEGTMGQTAADPMEGGEFSVRSGFTATCPPDCEIGDLDCDGSINGADLGIILLDFGPCATPYYCLSDIDGNGEVNGGDVALLLLVWQ